MFVLLKKKKGPTIFFQIDVARIDLTDLVEETFDFVTDEGDMARAEVRYLMDQGILKAKEEIVTSVDEARDYIANHFFGDYVDPELSGIKEQAGETTNEERISKQNQ